MPSLARLRSLRDDHPGFVAVGAVLLAFHLAYPAVDWWLRTAEIAPAFDFWDFGAYRGGVERWRAGEPLYVENEDGGYHGSYLYPPVALLLFAPFVGQPFGPEAWVLASALLLWVGLVGVVESLVGRRSWGERLLLGWFLCGFQPLVLASKMGQTAAFMAGLLCFAFVALERGTESRPARFASGALTGVVGVVKFAYAPVGAHLLADRDRFVGAVVAGIGLATLSLLAFGVESHRTYIEVLAWGVGQGGNARSPALWLAPYFRPLAGHGIAFPVRVAGSFVVAVYALCADGADRTVFALGVAAFPILTPLAYTYYFVALLPAAAILIHGELERGGRPVVPTLGLGFVSVHSYGLYAITNGLPDLLPTLASVSGIYFLLQPGLWGSVLLAGTAFVRVGESVSLPGWLPDASRDRV
jgi:alpha-1,2-mannosyltransferase